MYTLTEEEVKQFSLRIKLRQRRNDENNLEYLNEIIQSFQEEIPFQNVSLLATPSEERRRLTWNEIKSDLLSGRGGLCYSLNIFLHIYLTSLGYKSDLVLSTYGSPDGHTVIIVNDVINQSDKYMIDVGAGYASFVAIPLSFQDESIYYSFSYTTFKLKWDNQKENIMRIHKSASTGEEKVILVFNLKPIQDYQSELAQQEKIFTDPNFTPFHKALRILTFNRDGARVMQGKQFVKEDLETHKLQNQGEQLNDVNDFVKECVKQFPSINEKDCRLAFIHLFGQQNGQVQC